MIYTGKTYEEADKFLGKRDSKVCGSNSRMYRYQDYFTGRRSIQIYYYNTCIITYYRDDKVRIATGGHWTHTTITRINRWTNLSVHRIKGRPTIIEPAFSDCLMPFYEGAEYNN